MEKQERLQRIRHALEQGEMPYDGDLFVLSDLSAEELAQMQPSLAAAPAEVRRQLAHLLTVLADVSYERSFLDLFRLMLDDEDARVRKAALEGLRAEEAEDYRLIDPLTKLLRSDEAAPVRAAAAQALALFVEMGLEGDLSEARYRQVQEALLAAYRDTGETVEVRRRALEAVATAGGDEIAQLIDEAYESEAQAMRVSALYAMGSHGNAQRWKQRVLQALHSTDPEIRYEAAVASGKLDLAEAVPTLIELTEDVDDDVRKAAILSLGFIASEESIEGVLTALLEDEDESIREVAEEALGNYRLFQEGGDLDLLFPEA
jgi:HEAT repeat protein